MKILVGILFGPLAVFVLIELIGSSMSCDTAGERKILSLFSRPRYERRGFFALTMFLFIVSAIFVKKFLKWLEICLKFVITLLLKQRTRTNEK